MTKKLILIASLLFTACYGQVAAEPQDEPTGCERPHHIKSPTELVADCEPIGQSTACLTFIGEECDGTRSVSQFYCSGQKCVKDLSCGEYDVVTQVSPDGIVDVWTNITFADGCWSQSG